MPVVLSDEALDEDDHGVYVEAEGFHHGKQSRN